MRHLFDRPLGSASLPFGYSKKLIVGSIISGAGSAVGGVLGYISNKETNENNLQIARETNKQNYNMWREAIHEQHEQYGSEVFNTDRWRNQDRQWALSDRDYQNAYNSPEAQMERYRAAGLNPILMMSGQGAIGSAQTGQTSHNSPSATMPGPPQMQTGAPMLPYDFSGIGLGVQNAMNYHLASIRQEADIARMRAQTDNERLDVISKAIERNWHNKSLQKEMARITQDMDFQRENWSEMSRSIKVANDKIVADQAYQESMTKFQNIVNQYAPKNQRAVLAKLSAEYTNLLAAARNADASAAYHIANAALVDVEKSVKERTADAIVDEAFSRADEMEFRAGNEAKSYYDGELGRRLPVRHSLNGDIGNSSYVETMTRRDKLAYWRRKNSKSGGVR